MARQALTRPSFDQEPPMAGPSVFGATDEVGAGHSPHQPAAQVQIRLISKRAGWESITMAAEASSTGSRHASVTAQAMSGGTQPTHQAALITSGMRPMLTTEVRRMLATHPALSCTDWTSLPAPYTAAITQRLDERQVAIGHKLELTILRKD